MIPDGITTIGKYLFSKISCNSITFPSGIEEVKNNAFENAQFTQSFALDFSSLTTIGSAAFIGCSALSSLNFTNVTTIGTNSFDKTGLSGSISLPKLTTLGYNAFQDTAITSVDFTGSTITSIPNSVFMNCHNLASVELPSTCTSLGLQVFYACENLTTVNLSNITSIGARCFSGCTSLGGNLVLSNLTTLSD